MLTYLTYLTYLTLPYLLTYLLTYLRTYLLTLLTYFTYLPAWKRIAKQLESVKSLLHKPVAILAQARTDLRVDVDQL